MNDLAESGSYEQLLDYRRTVAELYRRVREWNGDPAIGCQQFRQARDRLFKAHPQSALTDEQRRRFHGLRYFPYDPALRFIVPLDRMVAPEMLEIGLQEDGIVRLLRFGKVHVTIAGRRLPLSLFWILGYGGGVFLPFGDATNNHETYGGGRYLLDTIKHADLGQVGDRFVIDFNYAYNPSCAYNPRWVCPLSPRENRLPVPIRAGEHAFAG